MEEFASRMCHETVRHPFGEYRTLYEGCGEDERFAVEKWKLKSLKTFKGKPNIPLEHTPDIPKPPNERNSFINCWLGVWGMLQGSVAKFLETYVFFN